MPVTINPNIKKYRVTSDDDRVIFSFDFKKDSRFNEKMLIDSLSFTNLSKPVTISLDFIDEEELYQIIKEKESHYLSFVYSLFGKSKPKKKFVEGHYFLTNDKIDLDDKISRIISDKINPRTLEQIGLFLDVESAFNDAYIEIKQIIEHKKTISRCYNWMCASQSTENDTSEFLDEVNSNFSFNKVFFAKLVRANRYLMQGKTIDSIKTIEYLHYRVFNTLQQMSKFENDAFNINGLLLFYEKNKNLSTNRNTEQEINLHWFEEKYCDKPVLEMKMKGVEILFFLNTILRVTFDKFKVISKAIVTAYPEMQKIRSLVNEVESKNLSVMHDSLNLKTANKETLLFLGVHYGKIADEITLLCNITPRVYNDKKHSMTGDTMAPDFNQDEQKYIAAPFSINIIIENLLMEYTLKAFKELGVRHELRTQNVEGLLNSAAVFTYLKVIKFLDTIRYFYRKNT